MCCLIFYSYFEMEGAKSRFESQKFFDGFSWQLTFDSTLLWQGVVSEVCILFNTDFA